jgi:SAM-dependent methyltransferase
MKRIGLLSAIAFAAFAAWLAALWLRERRRHGAFPSSDAAALLNPARRLVQSPAAVVAAAAIRPGDVVLELGPGPGYFTAEAIAAASPGGRIIALDLQPEMLVALRAHLCATASVDLVAGDAMRLPLRDAVIDAALLVSMLGEVRDRAAAVGEVARVLRPGGAVTFSETMNDPDSVRLPALQAMCGAAGLVERDRRRQLLGYLARFEALAPAL